MISTEYNQTSFSGGMNFLLDDTHLQNNQYWLGFNVRNRYGVLDAIPTSTRDYAFPPGLIQEVTTFGEYIIAFVAGRCYFRLYSDTGWTLIPEFLMSTTAPRYWTVAVPVSTTQYGRLAGYSTPAGGGTPLADGNAKTINRNNVSAAFNGNLPGLLVQDNVNQPLFIFLDSSGYPAVRTTQKYDDWKMPDWTLSTAEDKREYVPIGNAMAWCDGILYIASPDGESIYRSVSGRPLDFVVNVTVDGDRGGDATTTSYSVGVGGITALHALADGSLFVAASNSNFLVQKNMSQNAMLLWGEYTYIRQYLFEATCISDRCLIDSLGDTRFIDLRGVRSFNAIEQVQNEGRNTPFTATISRAFEGIVQSTAAAILFNNYEFYAVNTTFGPAIAVFDTLTGVWSSFDTTQTEGKLIKQLVKIEQGVQKLYAVTEDNKFYSLYDSTSFSYASLVTLGISPNILGGENGALVSPKFEIKPSAARFIFSNVTRDVSLALTAFVDSRASAKVFQLTKTIKYSAPAKAWTGVTIPGIGTQLQNVPFIIPDTEQGWKTSFLLEWSGGASITQFSCETKVDSPINPLNAQGGKVV